MFTSNKKVLFFVIFIRNKSFDAFKSYNYCNYFDFSIMSQVKLKLNWLRINWFSHFSFNIVSQSMHFYSNASNSCMHMQEIIFPMQAQNADLQNVKKMTKLFSRNVLINFVFIQFSTKYYKMSKLIKVTFWPFELLSFDIFSFNLTASTFLLSTFHNSSFHTCSIFPTHSCQQIIVLYRINFLSFYWFWTKD